MLKTDEKAPTNDATVSTTEDSNAEAIPSPPKKRRIATPKGPKTGLNKGSAKKALAKKEDSNGEQTDEEHQSPFKVKGIKKEYEETAETGLGQDYVNDSRKSAINPPHI